MTTPDNENMVERIARAIAIHGGRDPDRERAGAFQWQAYEGLARAAIAAMREPSEAMTRAGSREVEGDIAIHSGYRAMIDAALNGK